MDVRSPDSFTMGVPKHAMRYLRKLNMKNGSSQTIISFKKHVVEYLIAFYEMPFIFLMFVNI